tara:strand:+ start:436 stop:1722 length:1287 start_codon:yes stop_codon:yes gene_type:complete
MIFIYELICKSHSHEVCNAGFLKLYSEAFPNEKIFFYSNNSHIDCVKKELTNQISDKNVFFKKVSFSSDNGLINFIKKYFFIKKEKKKWVNNKVIFLSYNIIILKLLEFVLGNKNKFNLLLVSHGTFEFLGKNKLNPRDGFKNSISLYKRIKTKISQPRLLINLLIFNLKKIFNKFTSFPVSIFFKDFKSVLNSFDVPFVKFVLLSEHINLEIKKIENFKSLPRLVIPMPVIHKNFSINIPDNQINFGVIGYGMPDYQKKLLLKLESLKITKAYSFRLIGMQPEIFKGFKNVKIPKPKNQIYLNRLEMENEIKKIHFQIILYPEDSYRLSQSLSVFEALRYQKPIIHIKNPCVSFYNRKNSEIGIECNDVDDMSLQIENLVDDLGKTRELYKKFIENINLLRNKYKIETLAKNLQHTYNTNKDYHEFF